MLSTELFLINMEFSSKPDPARYKFMCFVHVRSQPLTYSEYIFAKADNAYRISTQISAAYFVYYMQTS